jgi:hypothetical protein
MLGIKDKSEIKLYDYTVCEISQCKNVGTKIFKTDLNSINICEEHWIVLENNRYTLW